MSVQWAVDHEPGRVTRADEHAIAVHWLRSGRHEHYPLSSFAAMERIVPLETPDFSAAFKR